MYNNVKLEKGLYNLAGKTFSQALTEMDPDCNYADGEMKGLDAYERQLKRFDIKVNGVNSDMVEKFFRTTESSVLFPEFVRRAVAQGINSTILSRIVAAKTTTDACDCRGIVLSDGDTAYTTAIDAEGEIPASSVRLASSIVTLKKYGRVINAPYEAVRQQRLDVFAVALKAVGIQIGKAAAKLAVDTITSGVTADTMTDTDFSYSELAAFWGKFTDFDMTTVICSPATAAKILAFTEMNKSVVSGEPTSVKTPFGAEIVVSSAVADTKLIGIDKDFALEMISGSDIIVDTDKLISSQIDKTAVTVTVGFSKIVSGAVRVLMVG